MKLINIVEQLRELGYEVDYYSRPEGGVRIKSINGQHFKGSEGGKQARKIVGETAWGRHNIPKAKVKLPSVDDTLKAQLRKAQYAYRKYQPKVKGKITTRKLKEYLKTHTKEEAIQALKNQVRYAKGLANFANIDILLEKISLMISTAPAEDVVYLQRGYERIDSRRRRFKDEWITPCYQACYDYGDKHVISALEWWNRIQSIVS